MNTDSINQYIEEHLSDKRKLHTSGVRTTAVALAKAYGADPMKADFAALCHDMCKGIKGEDLNRMVDAYGLDKERYSNKPNLAHSKLAAIMLQRDFGVTDSDVIHAVSFHTTGRAGMSLLEKVIFIADAIEPNRDYPGVEELRQATEKDLNTGCLMALSHTREHLEELEQEIDEDTLQAEAWFKQLTEKQNGK